MTNTIRMILIPQYMMMWNVKMTLWDVINLTGISWKVVTML